MTGIPLLILISALMFLLVGGFALLSHLYSLNSIKSRTVGDGQHGTARFASKAEIHRTFLQIPFTPKLWRQGKNLPTEEQQGLIIGSEVKGSRTTALVDTGDVHTLMIGAAGIGKTAHFLYPNIEYALASGMSFLTTDTKGDLFRNYATIAEKYYGYNVSVIDLRNPTRSHGNNMLHLVNKYTDLFRKDPKNLSHKAKAEKYAKILAKTIIQTTDGDYGQNAFFYDAAEGIVTSTILLVAEFCPANQRHIVSVFKLIQDLMAPSDIKGKSQFQILVDLLPTDHKARWFAGAALNSSDQAMASTLSTALSRLNAFLDTELEQVLCFDTVIDAERFCNTKSAIFLIMPEEDSTKYFIISLIIQQLYREILLVADENNGKLKNRVMLFWDEFGTLPPISSAEMIFSAIRSRRVSIVAIIQSLAQLEKNYGKEGADIIVDNCQDVLFSGFAPNSSSAEQLAASLGTKTILTGSISRSKNDPSQSLQMIERQLLTVSELKALPRGEFILQKTGTNPMRTVLQLFLKWGITFEDTFTLPETSARKVHYADHKRLMEEIANRYGTSLPIPPPPSNPLSGWGGNFSMPQTMEPGTRKSYRKHPADES